MVLENPKLIGQTVTVPLLLSDDADLFFKGGITAVQVQPGKGVATPSATTSDSFFSMLVSLSAEAEASALRLRPPKPPLYDCGR